MAFTPDQEKSRALIRQTMIATLMREQGMDIEQASMYADQQLAMSDPSTIGPGDTLQAQENPGHPLAEPQMPAQVSDQAAGAASPSSVAPAAPLAPGAGESIYDRLGPEGLEMLLAQGGIDEQRDQAMLLRNQEGPQGIGGIGRMNTYVAANPLAHLASGVEKHRAKKDIKRLREEEKEGNRTIIDLLRDKLSDEPDPEGPGFGLGVI